jgi:hypothetical protein
MTKAGNVSGEIKRGEDQVLIGLELENSFDIP